MSEPIRAWVITVEKKDTMQIMFLTNGTRSPSSPGLSQRASSAKIYKSRLRAIFMCDQINATGRYLASINEVLVNGAITLISNKES